ncbi:hypothetical protein GCM10020255_082700 [Rhodococcus baikonurensis]
MHQPLTADLNPADEVVAVYDRTGNPIGRATRSVVYSGGLWHASAGVLVRTGDGSRIYVHRRTDTKAVFGAITTVLPEVSWIQVRRRRKLRSVKSAKNSESSEQQISHSN